VERDMRPFRMDVPQADLDDLLERLSRTCRLTRFPAWARTTAFRWTTSRTCWSIGPPARSGWRGKES
jgi:hypothetical protein